MMAKKVVKGFYTDELKRIRPLTEYFGNGSQKLEERKEELTPKNEATPKIDANETKNGVSSVSGVSNFESKNISVEPTLNNIVQKLPTLPTPPTPDQHETNIKNSVDSINGVSNSCTSPTPFFEQHYFDACMIGRFCHGCHG